MRLSKIENHGSRGAICESYVATKKNLSITGVVHPQIDFPAFSKKRIPDGIFHVDAQGKLLIYDVKSGYVNTAFDAIRRKKNTFFDNNKTLSPIREKVIITQDL